MILKKEMVGNKTFLSGILSGDEDRFVVGMLVNNEIEGLVPTSALQINNNKILRYDTTGRVTLADIKGMKFNREKILNFMSSYAESVINLGEYLLSAQGLLLDEDKIYMDMRTGRVSFVCLPVKQEKTINPFLHLKQEVLGMQYDQKENCSYFLDIVNAFNSGKVNDMEGVQELIKKLMASEKTRTQAIPNEKKDSVSVQQELHKEPEKTATPEAGFKEKPMETKLEIKSEVKKGFSLGKKNEASFKETKTEVKKQSAQAAVPAGMMIPGMGAIPGLEAVLTQSRQEVPSKKIAEKKQKKGFFGKLLVKEEKAVKEEVQKEIMSSVIEKAVPTPDGYASVPGRHLDFGDTVMGEEECEETEILGTQILNTSSAFLMRMSTGQTMGISSDLFQIGKEGKSVQFYIGDNAAISRVHASIIKRGNDYYLMDNESKNGTHVNEERLTQGKMIKLKNNQEFRLADEWFRFRMN